MRQITELIIENYKSHKKTVIHPAPAGKVTVLTGISRSGKSNLFRAWQKLFYNIPSGIDFIRTGCDFCRITAKYDDGHIVSYRRTRGGISRYTIAYPDGRTLDLDEGREGIVPVEVQDITGIKPITISGLDPLNINIAEQLDGPFLGTKVTTAPARAKVLGKLAGTEELDCANKGLGTDIYHRKQDEKNLLEDVNEHQKNLKQYEYLEGLEKTLKQLGMVREKVKKFTDMRNKLQELATQRDCLLIKIRSEEERFAGTKFVEEAETRLAKLVAKSNKRTLVKQLSSRRNELVYGIIRAEDIIKDTRNIEEAGRKITTVENKIFAKTALSKAKNDLIITKTNISNAKMVIIQTETIAKAEALLAKVVEARSRREKLHVLSVQQRNSSENKRSAEQVLTETKGLIEAETLLIKIVAAKTQKEKLEILYDQINKAEVKKHAVETFLEGTKTLDAAEAILSKVVASIQKRKPLLVLSTQLASVAKAWNTADEWIIFHSKQVEQFQAEYIKTLKEAGVCPTCGCIIVPEKLKEVV